MGGYRVERDCLGEREVPAGALWGIHTLRAVENFSLAGRPVRAALVRAYGAVKLACARTNHELGHLSDEVFAALEQACGEMREGRLDEHVVVDALQGGAGTSTNMNVNEVLANRALQILGRPGGDYGTVDPLEDVNRHQSTNDTYPTALRVAGMEELKALEREVVGLQEAFEGQEKRLADVVKIGRTELQDAVLTTLGREMGAYAEAFARDRWRVFKCQERLREVNLGGTAIGTGLGAPRQFIFGAVEHLRQITRLPLARAANLVEATQNTDAFAEVSGILKALASNLLKVSGDLRLLSSGPEGGIGEVRLPARQAGSSIMPGKVNPVIPEAATQAALAVMGNDQVIGVACGLGNLELNAFLPLIAEALLGSLELLRGACLMLRRRCVEGLEADRERCREFVEGATCCATALVGKIGYRQAGEVAAAAAEEGKTIRQVVVERGLMSVAEYEALITPEAVTRLGS